MATKKEDEAYVETMAGIHLTEEQRLAKRQELIDSYKGNGRSKKKARAGWWFLILPVGLVVALLHGIGVNVGTTTTTTTTSPLAAVEQYNSALIATTSSFELPAGVSLLTIEADIRDQVVSTASWGFDAPDATTVVCEMVEAWVPGNTFSCNAYASSGSLVGTVSAIIKPAGWGQAGIPVSERDPFSAVFNWTPAT